MKEEFTSKKSRSTFTVTGDKGRAFITVSGEASYNRKAQDEITRVRRGGCDWDTAVWTAKMLAATY